MTLHPLELTRRDPPLANDNSLVANPAERDEFEADANAEANANVEVIVNWLVSQAEHILEHRLLGYLARKKMVEILDNFENRLKGLGIGHEMIGTIFYQVYLRIKWSLGR